MRSGGARFQFSLLAKCRQGALWCASAERPAQEAHLFQSALGRVSLQIRTTSPVVNAQGERTGSKVDCIKGFSPWRRIDLRKGASGRFHTLQRPGAPLFLKRETKYGQLHNPNAQS